jgi:hypothetical protein
VLGGLLVGLVGGAFGVSGCEDPPELERVAPPTIDREAAEALKASAYREALELALPKIRAALAAADPLAAWQLGFAPAASPPLSTADRKALERLLEPALTAVAEINETYLPGAEVVILRQLRFGLTRINDDLHRRAHVQRDAMVGLAAVDAYLDELRYRLLIDSCDTGCESLPAALAEDVADLSRQLGAASSPGVVHAAAEARARAGEARALASKPATAKREQLRAGLETLSRACEAYATWLDELAGKLESARGPAKPAGTQAEGRVPAESTGVERAAAPQQWADNPKPRAVADPVARLPAIIGAPSLVRLFSVEERIDLVPAPAFTEIERHVARWQVLREAMLDPTQRDAPEEPATVVDVDRCTAALERLRQGLATVPEVAPPVLDCPRYVALLGDEPRTQGQLLLDLLDSGVIEPQRRALRAEELIEVALVSGQWSTQVHTHLRRIMLLARLSEPAASALALREGRHALCWAEAALWIHAELGPPEEVALTLGGPCADLGDAASITARVTGDPRGALAGFGLSRIGDEPARMVGFDRFFWAPLGTMQTLATPKGMHPDEFTLPDDPAPAPEVPVQLEFENLSAPPPEK